MRRTTEYKLTEIPDRYIKLIQHMSTFIFISKDKPIAYKVMPGFRWAIYKHGEGYALCGIQKEVYVEAIEPVLRAHRMELL